MAGGLNIVVSRVPVVTIHCSSVRPVTITTSRFVFAVNTVRRHDTQTFKYLKCARKSCQPSLLVWSDETFSIIIILHSYSN